MFSTDVTWKTVEFLDGLPAPPADTLVSAGVGEDLVNDGVGPDLAVKGLLGGTNVNLVDDGNDITINSTAGAPLWETANFQLAPIATNNSSLTHASGSNTIGDANTNGCAFVSSVSCTIDGNGDAGCVNNTIVASNGASILRIGGSAPNMNFLACNATNGTTHASQQCFAVGNDFNSNQKDNCIILSDDWGGGGTLQPTNSNSFNTRFDEGYFMYSRSEMDTGVTMTNAGNMWKSVAEASPSRGHVRLTENPWAGRDFSFTTSFTELLPVSAAYTSNLSSDFTNPSGLRLKYTGAVTADFLVYGNWHHTNSDYAGAIAKNGTPVAMSTTYSFSNESLMPLTAHISLATNDEVTIYALKRSTGTHEIHSMCMMATKIVQ